MLIRYRRKLTRERRKGEAEELRDDDEKMDVYRGAFRASALINHAREAREGSLVQDSHGKMVRELKRERKRAEKMLKKK